MSIFTFLTFWRTGLPFKILKQHLTVSLRLPQLTLQPRVDLNSASSRQRAEEEGLQVDATKPRTFFLIFNILSTKKKKPTKYEKSNSCQLPFPVKMVNYENTGPNCLWQPPKCFGVPQSTLGSTAILSPRMLWRKRPWINYFMLYQDHLKLVCSVW